MSLNIQLITASKKGHTECVRLLLEAGADKNSKMNDGKTPLHLASLNGHTECVRLLLEAGADKNSKMNDGKTPLHLASHNGHPECVRLLLEAGADNDVYDNYGFTPLRIAHAYYYNANCSERKECHRLLQEAETKSSQNTEKLSLILHEAAKNGQVEIVRMLLEVGADKTVVDGDGKTASFYASQNGHAVCLQLLL
jgi:cytohesin